MGDLMLRTAFWLVLLGVLVACTPPPNGGDGGSGGGRGGGTGGGGGALAGFELIDLDPTARDATYFSMAVDAARERVGVAYFTPRGTMTMAGTPDFDLKYVEWSRAGGVTAPQTIRFMQRIVGLSLVFEPTSGEPLISYLGGAAGFEPGQSIYWFQSDAVINRRSNGTWTETVVAANGNQVRCGNAVSDRGFLVGLWASLVFDSTGKLYLAYRDGHAGQYPQQDWAGSDVELWEGALPPTTPTCLSQGGNNKDAWGGHVQLALGPDDQPAIIYDQMPGTGDTNGANVIFQRRKADGTWTPAALLLSIGNTQTGASIAYDSMEGLGIAVVDRATNELKYINSANGTAWSAVDPVFGSGSGGWYPSLAMDPVNHEPAIAFYICSPSGSENETSCTTTDDRLVVTQRIGGNWRETLVDEGGGYHPKLGFLTPQAMVSKRVVAYRAPAAIDPATGITVTTVGALKLAVER